jgi:Divergent InlB B-repeat domain
MPRWPTCRIASRLNGTSGIRAARTLSIVAILGIALVLLISSGFSFALSAAPVGAAGAAPHASLLDRPAPVAAKPHPPTAPTPTAAAPLFFSNTSSNSPLFTNGYSTCYGYPQTDEGGCNGWTSQPTLLHLSNGELGLTYAAGTTITNDVCGGLTAGNGSSRIAFTTSSNGGVSWNVGSLIGQTNASCPYYQQFEPSFATNASGGIVGVYVGGDVNATDLNLLAPPVTCCTSAGLYGNYTNRSSDALIFTNSSNDGASFNETILHVVGANIADPAIATYGNSIYVVYENISNTTVASPQILPGYWNFAPSPNYAISVWMLYSNDGGVSWNAPIPLPGENATEFNTSMSPAIAVSSSGEVAVAYLTNRACIAYCNSTSFALVAYGDDVVDVTSTNNGTTWSAVHTVYSRSGEASLVDPYPNFGNNMLYGYSDQLYNLFQYEEAPVIAFNTSGSQLYIAWSGSYNTSSPVTPLYLENYDWAFPTIFAGTSTNGGATWNVRSLMSVGTYNTTVYPGYTFPNYLLDPGLAVSNGTAYLSFYFQNGTESYYVSGAAYCGYTGGSRTLAAVGIEELVTSSNGVDWSSGSTLDFNGGQGYTPYPGGYTGTSSTILVLNGSPVSAFSFPGPETCNYYCYYPTAIDIATPYTGPTTNVTFVDPSLAPGQWLYFGVANAPYELNSSGLTLTGIPIGLSIDVNVSSPGVSPTGYLLAPVGGGGYTFFGPTNVTLSSRLYTYANITGVPLLGEFEWEDDSSTYDTNEYAEIYAYYDPYAFPPQWLYENDGTCYSSEGLNALVPVDQNFTIGFMNYTSDLYIEDDVGTALPPSLVVGSGAGAYSGPDANFTINVSGPVSETFYFYPVSQYSVAVSAPALPSGTPYQFDWNGALEQSSNGAALELTNVSTGYYSIENATATSSQSGWIYAGVPQPANPIYIPLTTQVTLSFAHVDVASAAGTITFQAQHLTAGTVWQLEFNGTEYSSDTPTITVTDHAGVYPIAASAVTSENASAEYAPVGVGPTISVTPGNTYDVNYTSAYEVTAYASEGGTITTPGSQWVAPGTVRSYTATVAAGYMWEGWTGSGAGSYTGSDLMATVTANSPILETANFAPQPANHYSLIFDETGVPNGTAWSVSLDNFGYSSTGPSITVPDLFGCSAPSAQSTYHLFIPDAYAGTSMNETRYVPGSYSTSFCIHSTPTTMTIVYQAEYYVTVAAASGGSATFASGGGGFGASGWVLSGSSGTLKASPNVDYLFVAWIGSGPGSYSGSLATSAFTVSGPVTETATFMPAPPPPGPQAYTVTFTLAAPFASGTVWSVSLGSSLTFASNGTELNATGLASSTYSVTVASAYAPDHQTEYLPITGTFSLTVHANGSKALSFSTNYWVSVSTTGPGSAAPASGWHLAGTSVTFAATPSFGGLFDGWTGTGAGSYTGSLVDANVTVNAPITETAAFSAAASGSHSTSTTSVWSSLGAEAGLAIVGLVVGLVVGMLVVRARRPPAGSAGTGATDGPESAGPGGAP